MPRSPLVVFGVMVSLSLLSVACVLFLSLRQPWLGLTLQASPDGAALVVLSATPSGPAAAVPVGTTLVSVARSAAPLDQVALRGVDRLEEPDGLPTVAEMQAFFAHQGRIAEILRAEQILLKTDQPERHFVVTPAPMRPLWDLPGVFWVQLLTGIVGLWLGGWVFALRQGETAPTLLAGTGAGLAISAHAAALYSTRELALPEGMFAWASAINSSGALLFGACMVSLFLVHPVRLVSRRVMLVCLGFMLFWAALALLRPAVSTLSLIHLPVLLEMLLIVLAAIAQTIASRRRPKDRSALRWFGLSVVIGAGSFVFLIVAPQVIGIQPTVSQGHAFGMFMVVYIGMAISVARYRLFAIEDWAFRLLFYTTGVVLLLGIDVFLLYVIALDRIPAFSIALLVIAFLYLPARAWIGRRLLGAEVLSQEETFNLVSNVGLAATADEQRRRVHLLMSAAFRPMDITEANVFVQDVEISNGGECLDLPAIDRVPPLRLRWAQRGKRLFTPKDLRRARVLLQMVQQILDQRNAYEAGAREERRRINRDIHDNVGVQLLGALHSTAPPRKDTLIRQALTDLREIIANSEGDAFALNALLADLRSEVTEHLGAAQIAVDWTFSDMPDLYVAPSTTLTLRATLRELAGNVLRHSGAAHVRIRIDLHRHAPSGAHWMTVHVSDDGKGLSSRSEARTSDRVGQGLSNLRQRAEAQGGRLEISTPQNGIGTAVTVEFPVHLAPLTQGRSTAPEAVHMPTPVQSQPAARWQGT